MLVIIGFGPMQVIAPCRIVYLLDEPDRFGFAYGTLPGHPELGEESFMVDRQGDETFFRIVAFSRPAEWLTRLGAPISRRVRRHFTRSCLQTLATYGASAL